MEVPAKNRTRDLQDRADTLHEPANRDFDNSIGTIRSGWNGAPNRREWHRITVSLMVSEQTTGFCHVVEEIEFAIVTCLVS
jgi:hypothetical protein